MWHEARKHERKLRGMMVDYKKRAERRREYYEKIKKDPAQFLQVHGRACKVHLDSAVALAAESPVNMMPWQGDTNNMIDRFDVRAHLDHIPDYTPPLLTTISPEQESDERKCNYERYRGLVQNDFAGISEEQCLYQIYIDELYGGLQRPSEDEKKNLSLGADVEVDVDELNQEQVADLNKQATTYGMADGDFVRMLRKDKEEAEAIKHAKALEEEKAMYSGRRSRRQRREFREKRLRGRKISPPSYARRDSPTYDPYKRFRAGGEVCEWGPWSLTASLLPRRAPRSRSRSGDRYRRGGRGPRHHSSSRSRSSWSLSPSRSRSLTQSRSPSQSRSRSPSQSRSRSHSQSHSPSPAREKLTRPAASPAVGEKLKKTEPAAGKETGAAKPKLTPQEKLKLRMQKALNRQFKADKKAAQEKMIQQEHERQEREDELRAMARKIRMKERERREKEREEWERQYSRQSRSPSPRYSREYSSSRRRSRSRSRSPHYRH
ncbi:CLK4-associating serine/arginine rich protein [Pteropus vampyrus]|uniref:CLK4-associating serine/arginine rich protein n=1 Tax=Pteropus vampyrus TaxID=132908 RepID=A0A6P6CUN8_PTEVA|nr:CLK4-associating serine/arginine rich protein [Pteropus vampyrus]